VFDDQAEEVHIMIEFYTKVYLAFGSGYPRYPLDIPDDEEAPTKKGRRVLL
jgi:hypothetical protein